MLFRRKKTVIAYDSENKVPSIRASICTGEKVAGFRDLRTGAFEEIMLIRGAADLAEFRERYGITGEIEKKY
ncbi:MAG: aspartate dehydrogenase [Oscillospiraceae bacterium]|nr:aspartate dehydrogenase [Oscillospiraceae bacterium]